MEGYSGFALFIADDFSRFAKQFVSKQSFSFSTFKAVWKELNFDELYAGRGDNRECYIYGKDLMRSALDYLCPDNEPLVKAMGLYLCYTIHKTFPHITKLLIRLSVKEWEELVDFIKYIDQDLNNETSSIGHSQDLWHVVHIFKFLQKEKAFCLCYSKREMFPVTHTRHQADDGEDLQELFAQQKSLKKIFGTAAMDELEAVKEEYDLSKEEAIKTNSGLKDALVPEGDFFNKIKEELKTFETWKRSYSAGRKRSRRSYYSEDENEPSENWHLTKKPRTVNPTKKRYRTECKFTPKRLCEDNDNTMEDAADDGYDELQEAFLASFNGS